LPDGRQLYLECRGEGSPTVIFEAGSGNAADLWSALESGYLTTNQPDLIIDAVRAVVDAVRRGDLQVAPEDLAQTGRTTWLLVTTAAALSLIGTGLLVTVRWRKRSPNV